MSRVATGAVMSAPGSESADRDASDESSFIGKPFYQHGHRNDVAETETDAADQSVTDVSTRPGYG